MILYVSGNLFQSPAQVLVNTVNTVGAMGKGVALDFKRLYPEMFQEYRQLCEAGEFKIGSLYLYKSPNKLVLNFPTKQHWRSPSRVEFVEAGLRKFVASYGELGIHSIAFPPLGCGHGQLDFRSQVQPLMELYLRELPIEVFIYPTYGTGDELPEHLEPERMREWLRLEPSSLPFSEVWSDLTEVLGKKHVFQTAAKGNEFGAKLLPDGSGIEVESSNRRYTIKEETLTQFWQQLRTHGFSMRKTKPGQEKTIYYLVPVFSSLPYVEQVKISDSYEDLTHSPSTGLQVLPIAFNQQKSAQQLNFLEIS